MGAILSQSLIARPVNPDRLAATPSPIAGLARSHPQRIEQNLQAQTIDNLEDIVEQHKALSLAYQLMLAIARQNNHESHHNSKPAPTSSSKRFDFEIDYSFKSVQTISMELTAEYTNSLSSQSISLSFNEVNTLSVSFNQQNNELELNISIIRETQLSLTASSQTAEPQQSDPLILNLDQSDFNFEPGVIISFDLNADGSLDKISKPGENNAFLALDENANGLIDNGTELFGDTQGARDGFDDLTHYDLNHDGQINAQDKVFENLLLLNFNQQGEQSIRSLSSENVESISLEYELRNRSYLNDNLLVSESEFTYNDGSLGRMGDFLLSYS